MMTLAENMGSPSSASITRPRNMSWATELPAKAEATIKTKRKIQGFIRQAFLIWKFK